MCQTPPRFSWDMEAVNNKFWALRKCYNPSSANIQLPLYDIWRGTMAGLFCDKGLQTLQGGNIHLNWIFVKLEPITLIARFCVKSCIESACRHILNIPAFYIPTAINIKGKNHNHIFGFWVYLNGLCNSDQSRVLVLPVDIFSTRKWETKITPVTCDSVRDLFWLCSRKSTSSMIGYNTKPQKIHQHWEGNKLRTQHSREYAIPCQSYNARISMKIVYSNPQSCWCMQKCFSWQWHQWIAM